MLIPNRAGLVSRRVVASCGFAIDAVMHETPIAIEIVNQVVQLAADHGAIRVEQVEVQVGAMRQVVPEALELAFSVVSEGTLAEGAVLRITEVPAAANCNHCGRQFAPDIDVSFACPACGQADVRITAGNDIILQSVVCETDEQADVSS
jgi:hydrogenase nickel incorporation protein HypA/HybF